MKEFNLEAALNGEPVMLRNERKAFVMYDLRNYPDLMDKLGRKPLNGVVFNKDESIYTNIEWNEFGANSLVQYDIMKMWEEPKISIDDLPKPFAPEETQHYYYINGGYVECEDEFVARNEFDKRAAKNGNCFRTKEDAQKWIHFMKGMME